MVILGKIHVNIIDAVMMWGDGNGYIRYLVQWRWWRVRMTEDTQNNINSGRRDKE